MERRCFRLTLSFDAWATPRSRRVGASGCDGAGADDVHDRGGRAGLHTRTRQRRASSIAPPSSARSGGVAHPKISTSADSSVFLAPPSPTPANIKAQSTVRLPASSRPSQPLTRDLCRSGASLPLALPRGRTPYRTPGRATQPPAPLWECTTKPHARYRA